jgi:agmatinase
MEEQLISEGLAAPRVFAGLPLEHSSWEHAHVALLPIPYDLTTSYQAGTRRGPQAILEASLHVELYDEELKSEPYQLGVHTLPPLEPLASGPEAMSKRIEHVLQKVLDAKKFPIVLGGDHSITPGVVRALVEKYGELSVLQLDAHADLRDSYQGTRYSHACVGRRVSEIARLFQIGIRSLSSEEAECMSSSNVTTVFARELHRNAKASDRVLNALSDPVYITLDVDVLDPSIMPATGTPEPGGLGWHTVLLLLRQVFEKHRVVGCDVVELAPIPGMTAPDFLVAKLVYKLIGYLALSQVQRGSR